MAAEITEDVMVTDQESSGWIPGFVVCDVDQIAQAVVMVETPEDTVFYCGHHYTERENRFSTRGYKITDHRDILLNRLKYLDMWSGGVNGNSNGNDGRGLAESRTGNI